MQIHLAHVCTGSSEERTRREPRPAAAAPTREARPAAVPSDAPELRRREAADASAAPARGDNHTAAAGNGMPQAEAAPGNAGRADAAGGEAGGSTAPAGAKRKRDDGQPAAGARAPSPGRDGGRHRSSSTTRERGKDAQRDAAKPGREHAREPSHDRWGWRARAEVHHSVHLGNRLYTCAAPMAVTSAGCRCMLLLQSVPLPCSAWHHQQNCSRCMQLTL